MDPFAKIDSKTKSIVTKTVKYFLREVPDRSDYVIGNTLAILAKKCFQEHTAWYAYARTIARNESFKELRFFNQISEKQDTLQEQEQESTRGAETKLSQYEFINELVLAIDNCTPKQKEAILLKSILNNDMEIAKTLNVSPASISERLTNAYIAINKFNPDLLNKWSEISRRKIEELNVCMIYFEKCTNDFFDKADDYETIGYYMRDIEGIRDYEDIAFFLDKYYKKINNIEGDSEIISVSETKTQIRATRQKLLKYYEQKGITETVRIKIKEVFNPHHQPQSN
jgi:RNA polymerase sigma factor (sigma-70 family)